MSREQYDDNCPDCRPALLNMNGQRMPDDCPEMIAVNRVWGETALEERQAFHRVTCLNSRTPDDLAAMEWLTAKIQDAISEIKS